MRRWISPTQDTGVLLEEKSSIQPLITIASACVFQTFCSAYIFSHNMSVYWSKDLWAIALLLWSVYTESQQLILKQLF